MDIVTLSKLQASRNRHRWGGLAGSVANLVARFKTSDGSIPQASPPSAGVVSPLGAARLGGDDGEADGRSTLAVGALQARPVSDSAFFGGAYFPRSPSGAAVSPGAADLDLEAGADESFGPSSSPGIKGAALGEELDEEAGGLGPDLSGLGQFVAGIDASFWPGGGGGEAEAEAEAELGGDPAIAARHRGGRGGSEGMLVLGDVDSRLRRRAGFKDEAAVARAKAKVKAERAAADLSLLRRLTSTLADGMVVRLHRPWRTAELVRLTRWELHRSIVTTE